jgi:protein ImuA
MDPRIDHTILDRLRAAIEPIERPWAAPSDRPSIARERSAPWTFGLEALDGRIGGLEPSGLHEIRPESHQDWGAAFGLVLGLAVRRILLHPNPSAAVLWCATTAVMGELGVPYAPGLLDHGLAPERLLLVEAGHENDVLWAAEEGMRSGAPALVIALARELELTPARRLSLAAGASGVPCLALSFPGAAGSGAALTRWRVGRLPSQPRRLGDRRTAGPGIAALRLTLERCRQRRPPAPLSEGGSGRPADMSLPVSLFVEWCHATHRFRLAAPLPDRASETRPARRHR